jgi:predicted kinase
MLAPHAAPQALRERIIARNVLGTDASEATLEVLAQQQQQLQPLAPDELSDIDSR